MFNLQDSNSREVYAAPTLEWMEFAFAKPLLQSDPVEEEDAY